MTECFFLAEKLSPYNRIQFEAVCVLVLVQR
jgi:hypothetical protein